MHISNALPKERHGNVCPRTIVRWHAGRLALTRAVVPLVTLAMLTMPGTLATLVTLVPLAALVAPVALVARNRKIHPRKPAK